MHNASLTYSNVNQTAYFHIFYVRILSIFHRCHAWVKGQHRGGF